MARVVWTGPAVEDLRQVHQFIARDSTQYAGITVRRIRESVAHLERFPESGRVVPEFPDAAYREVLVGRYRAVCRFVAEKNRVRVLAVVHGSRLLPPLLAGR